VIWVYAICESGAAEQLHGAGLAGASLESVREDGLVAVISRHAEPPDERLGDALVRHEQTVELLMDAGAVLPMRFGSRVADIAALRDALAARHSELVDALDAVRGRVELGVRALWQGGHPADARPFAESSGAGYVRMRLQVLHRDEEAAAAIHEPLAAMAADASRHPERPGEVLRGSYLVERAAVDEFRARARELQALHAELAVLCTGPWPPYSFVELPALALR
jgi:Gas vesicle synthesis protein GvpL/GvpF